MSITLARRISQVFFLLLFVWLCLVLEEGENFWQLSGWPVNLLLEADPLAMLGVLAASGVIHGAMLLALFTLLISMLWGRVFCGFICPLGTINHFIGWLALRKKTRAQKALLNQYHSAQNIKYYVLALFIAAALAGWYLVFLDPIPLLQRSFTLVLLPLAKDGARLFQQAAPMAFVFCLIVLANLWRPRFFCRYVCPLGALLGLVSRLAWWRPQLNKSACINCMQCAANCQAAAEPQAGLYVGECVMCLNCLQVCPADALLYGATELPAEVKPDISRRLSIAGLALGALTVASKKALSQPPLMLRPPGSLPEKDFLARCLRCGQCIAVCPTNVLQPASLLYGMENYLTPMLNPNYGYCRVDCVQCARVCPTSAIGPISREMRLGFDGNPPWRMGLAHIDRNLCLPWAYDRPCLVCEENCPVSPKAIVVDYVYRPVSQQLAVTAVNDSVLSLTRPLAEAPGGDLWIKDSQGWREVLQIKEQELSFAPEAQRALPQGEIRLYRKLAQPRVDAQKCIGCGVCQYLCPLEQSKAVRVLPENKSGSQLFI